MHTPTSPTFGAFFKQLRKRKGLTLRKFCLENGLDPGNISKLERDKAPPPGREILERYAGALQIEEDSSDWFQFFDLAAAARGRIPEDLMSDRELVGKLPLVFRTLRGEKVSQEELDRLAESIRRA